MKTVQTEKKIIEAVKEFISTCPYLKSFVPVNTNFTDNEAYSYGISSSGEPSPLATYFDGSEERQHNFALYTRQFTSADVERMESIGFLEDFSRWLDEKTNRGELPDLGESREPISMQAYNGALFDISEDGESGLYQIQFNLIYEQKGDR